MADDLTSGVAELIARERGGDVAPAKEPETTTPDPASVATDKQPTEHQTDKAAQPKTEKAAPKEKQPEATPEAKPAFDPAALTPEQVNELLRSNKAAQSAAYRLAQSMKDKELARIRQEQEAQRKAAEERRRLEEMDDEDYGRHIREQQRIEELVRQRAIETMVPVLQQVQGSALGALSDAQLRAELEARITSGELNDLGQIVKTIIDSEVSAREQKMTPRLETKLRKEIREALEKERAAEQADDDDTPPILGSGLPTGSRELHGTALIAAGVAEMRREARKRK